ncbi:MAG: Cytochrome c oxidase subunit CcoP (EC [uncultured Sulfurovum sp.]|uniref:Cytochrome c oxidase subunit CcoP (EC) n=1 Tax=uncultured Sulfurovum sp. TaxID=269237 RepID=A0A6S6TXE1_9BACT|nr:MAG: Cytochrome c oxidase subunit CcoP (EC [uncultured Sulfurovum sp.]
MNAIMIKTLGFAALLMIATIAVVMNLNIDILGEVFKDGSVSGAIDSIISGRAINAITMAGALAIAGITAYVTTKYIGQMKTETATGELVDENWDGIGERTNELPSGWAYSFLAVFFWSMWYGLIAYPVDQFSQIGQYNEEVLAHKATYEKKFENASPEELKNMGKSLYFVQCAPCHGNTGDGLSGKAQDLTKRMSEAQILDVIKNGSSQLHYQMPMMPPGTASGEAAKEIAAYVAGGLKGEAPASYVACTSCHGADSKGNNGLAPDLTGYDNILMTKTLQHGKKGIIGTMPAFKTMITPIQEKALTAYIQSIAQ